MESGSLNSSTDKQSEHSAITKQRATENKPQEIHGQEPRERGTRAPRGKAKAVLSKEE